MTRSRRANNLSSQLAALDTTAAEVCDDSPNDRKYIAINTLLALAPFSIFTLVILVLSYGFKQPLHPRHLEVERPNNDVKRSIALNVASPPVPTLHDMVANVADALDNAKVTHWLMPSLGLFAPSKQRTRRRRKVLGRLNPWQEGIDLGVFHEDVLQILLAQAKLQENGIIAVESYFGLRMYHVSGRQDDRYDFRIPFVDLFYFRSYEGNLTSSCCNCGPVTVSACTKKLCTCLECTFPMDGVFPTSAVQIESMRRTLNAPRDTSALLLPSHLPGVLSSTLTNTAV